MVKYSEIVIVKRYCMLEVLKYILLGLVQGLAEVLPISSSAHLIIAQEILGISEEGLTFEIFLHLASLMAILVFLWKKFWKLLKGFFLYLFKKQEENKREFMYCWYIVISTIPTVIFTLVLKDLVDLASSTLWVVGLLLIINAIMLFFLTRIQGIRKEEDLNWKDALVIGCFQCAGIFPGISRSGSCISGAFARKIDKETAADYAFIMFIPAVVGATVLELTHISEMTIVSSQIPLYLISFIIAGLATYFAFKLLLTVIRKGKLSYFSIYCALVGTATIIYSFVK